MVTRREKVIVDISVVGDRDLIRLAGAAALADSAIGSLGKNRLTSLNREIGGVRGATRSLEPAGRDLDRFSGRLAVFRDLGLTIGPAAIPITATMVPALTTLASATGFAVIAGGTLVTAYQGVGDALKAVGEAQIEPTTDNLEAARIAMQRLSPAARDMVRDLRSLRDEGEALRDTAAATAFPGISDLLDDLEETSPRLERLLAVVGNSTGEVARELGEGIAGPRTAEFLEFLRAEAPSAIDDTAAAASNLIGGLGELWMAFAPVNRDALQWLREGAEDFDDWAAGLSETEGFQEFLAYLDTNGPRAGEALSAIADALLQILEAAAPLGGPALIALEAVADVIAAIADSDAGPAIMATVTALTLLRRSTQAYGAVTRSGVFTNTKESLGGMVTALGSVTTAQERATLTAGQLAGKEKEKQKAIRGGLGTLGRGAALMGGLAFASSGAAEGIGLSNTVSLALMGTMAGPWGAAIGGGIGLMLDFAAAGGDAKEEIGSLRETLNQQTGALTENTAAWVANKFVEDGTADDAAELGLSLADLTGYIMGEEEAITRVTDALDAQSAGQGSAIRMTEEGAISYDKEKLAADGVHGALGSLTERLGVAQAETRAVATATGAATTKWESANDAATLLRESLIQLNNVLERRASLRDYEAALDDFAATLNDVKNKARLLNKDGTINIDVKAGREVEAALDNIASTAIEVANNLKGTQKIEVLNRARADIRDAAEKLGMNREQIRALLIDMGLLDRKKSSPRVELEAGSAASILANIDRELDAIDGRVTKTYVEVVRTGDKYFKDVPAGADGMTVPGPRYPYADRTLVLAAPGEEIITNRNGEADRFRADRAAGRIPAYADGGTVGTSPTDSRSFSSRSSAPSITVAPASLDGMHLEGRIDADGYLRGVIRKEARAAARGEVASAARHDRILEGV